MLTKRIVLAFDLKLIYEIKCFTKQRANISYNDFRSFPK
jgi:hypothetical protein